LIQASRYGHDDVCVALVDAGSDINAVNDEGFIALDYAKLNDYTNIIELLSKWTAEDLYNQLYA
jgi:ankyrin repeat protein